MNEFRAVSDWLEAPPGAFRHPRFYESQPDDNFQLLPLTSHMVDVMAVAFHAPGPYTPKDRLLGWWRHYSICVQRMKYGPLINERLADLTLKDQVAALDWFQAVWHPSKQSMEHILLTVGAPTKVVSCATELHARAQEMDLARDAIKD